MPSARGIRAGRAFVEIYGDNNPLSRALKRSGAMLKSWGNNVRNLGMGIAAAGTAALAPFLGAAKSFASAGDALNKMSQRMGASVEFLSALGHAADLGGTDLQTMETGIRRLQRSAYEAAQGTKTYADAFRDLGVSAQNADGSLKGTEQLFMDTVEALSAVENETKKAALAQQLFGRSGTQLLPMLNSGKEGLKAAMEEAKRLGLVMSEDDAQAAADLTDAWTRLTKVAKRLWVNVGATLAKALTDLANRAAPIVTQISEWVRANSGLIMTIAGVVAAGIAAGIALVGLGTILAAAGTVLTAAAVAVGLLVKAVLLLVSPVGLAVAALVGLVGYAAYASGALGSAFGTMKTAMADIGRFFGDTLQGMKDALAAGDFQLAAKVLWTSLKLAWVKGTEFLKRKWIEFKFAAAEIWTEIWNGIRVMWAEASAAVATTWVKATDTIADAWTGTQRGISHGIAWLMAKLEGVDPEQVAGILDEDLARKKKDRKRATGERLRNIARQRREAVEGIGADQSGAMRELDKDRERALRGLQKDVDQAAADWRAAISEARQKREAAASSDAPARPDAPTFNPETFDAGRRSSVAGTFSAVAAAGLGAGSAVERTATATEETAKNTKEILRRWGPPLFT